jgi:hypothetical protein
MLLKFDRFDGRSLNIRDIIDGDTGKIAGQIASNGVGFNNSGGIDISLPDSPMAFQRSWITTSQRSPCTLLTTTSAESTRRLKQRQQRR